MNSKIKETNHKQYPLPCALSNCCVTNYLQNYIQRQSIYLPQSLTVISLRVQLS